jgi:flagellar basal body-associated protein FliL
MQVQVPEEGSAEDHEQVRIPKDRPLGLIHSGNRYAFGYGPDTYGIWDAAASGAPAETFPSTEQGRQEGWHRYLELEPSAAGTVITQLNPDEVWRREVEQSRRQRRRRSILVFAVIVVLAVGGGAAFALTRSSGPAKAQATLSEAAKAKKAHIDVSGDLTASEDLTQNNFNSTGLGSLFGSAISGEWKGTTVDLSIDVHSPTVGTFATTVITNKTVKITFTKPDGNSQTVTSQNGECKITVDSVVDDGFSGSFECTGLKLPEGEKTKTFDAKGTYGASK